MGSGGPAVPDPALLLLLLLLLLLSAGSFPHSLQGSPDFQGLGLDWGRFHDRRLLSLDRGRFHQDTSHHRSKAKKLYSCEGAFDLYFILDASDSVKSSWKDVYRFVNEVVKKYPNPKLRMSFITYSTQGHTLMKLTSDRNEIRDGLSRLQNVVPTGATNMHEGFKKSPPGALDGRCSGLGALSPGGGDRKAVSLIIALAAGALLTKPLRETKNELNSIVLKDGQMYAEDGFRSFEDFVNSLVGNSCMEITAGDSYLACVGDKKPTSVTKEKLICPGHVFEKDGQKVVVDFSLNNGVSFMGEPLKITSKDCPDATAVPKTETSVPTTVTQKRTPVPTTVTRKRTPVPTTVTRKRTPRTPVPTIVTQKDTPVPTTVTPKETPVPTTVTQKRTPVPTTVTQKETPMPTTIREGLTHDKHFFFPVLIPALLMFPVLIWCIWCCRRHKLDTLCNFVQSCNQVPLMWCQPRDKGRCICFTLVKPPCTQMPCSSEICLQPSQECFPNSCCSRCQHPPPICSRPSSRMLSLIPPPAQTLCRTALSLPPP
ncbi:PREDICTED: anthrax toxin receptor-like [Ceratotherium simum simum]|uniref:Anthrax toxin receptor-like n=1 Tax=Ceratotherium simum simum TaxID=73337 RepID=A0ABM1CY91_CERSS|nr:PREDICTED: anthrax toxin receptor-like [Ceratotherium simum simum]